MTNQLSMKRGWDFFSVKGKVNTIVTFLRFGVALFSQNKKNDKKMIYVFCNVVKLLSTKRVQLESFFFPWNGKVNTLVTVRRFGVALFSQEKNNCFFCNALKLLSTKRGQNHFRVKEEELKSIEQRFHCVTQI